MTPYHLALLMFVTALLLLAVRLFTKSKETGEFLLIMANGILLIAATTYLTWWAFGLKGW